MSHGWIGVDLDGTLAHYDGWKGDEHIGRPIPAMVARVKRWLEEGRDVRIFTARVAISNPRGCDDPFHQIDGYHLTPTPDGDVLSVCDSVQDSTNRIYAVIQQWCLDNIGQQLAITNIKDMGMVELWDDRAVRVSLNIGHACAGCAHYADGTKKEMVINATDPED